MGRDKECKSEPSFGAFSRMSYLYQAAHTIADASENTCLSNYYYKIMKEISKKFVERLHPDLKRSICIACNHSLTARHDDINVTIKSYSKKKKLKKNKMKQKIGETRKDEANTSKYFKNKSFLHSYEKSRVEARNKRPNRIKWKCVKCGFSKSFLQRPSYQIWIHNKFIQED